MLLSYFSCDISYKHYPEPAQAYHNQIWTLLVLQCWVRFLLLDNSYDFVCGGVSVGSTN